ELHHMGRLVGDVEPDEVLHTRAVQIVRQFGAALPSVRRALDLDVMAAYQGDPAAQSVDEVLLCYPGVSAMIHHRLASVLYKLGVPMLARIVAEIAHADTGIEIGRASCRERGQISVAVVPDETEKSLYI